MTTFSVVRATSAENETTSANVSPEKPEPVGPVVPGQEHRHVPLLHVGHPGLLHEGGMLDQPSQAELAHAGAGHRLRIGQAVGGVEDAGTLLGQVGQQAGALVGDGGHESGHGVLHFCRRAAIGDVLRVCALKEAT